MKTLFSANLSFGERPVAPLSRTILLCLLAVLGMLMVGASCSSGPKMGMDAEGQPVEHKVFYEGWGWRKSGD